MRRLILLRHAKAEAHAESGADFDRALAPRGVEEASEIGERLATQGYRPDRALISPALRARQTWDGAAQALSGAELRLEPALFDAEPDAILRLAEAAGEGCDTLVVVAHNPGLQELVVRLLVEGASPAAYLAQARRGFPPAAAAVFDFDAAGRPSAEALIYPKGAA